MPPKSKAAAAAAAAEPVSVEDLFSALHRHIEAGQFPQAVKVADQGQALSLSPPTRFRRHAVTLRDTDPRG
jgi:signal recognition particle subunit SRP72